MVEPNSGWLGKLGVDGVDGDGWGIVNTRNRGIGCQQGVNKSIGGGRGGCRWLGGCSRFPVITRIQYDGFLWGFGVETPDGYQSPGWTILVVLEVVDSLGQGTNREFVGDIGVDGVGGGDTNGVGCWLNGWVVYRGGFPIKM